MLDELLQQTPELFSFLDYDDQAFRLYGLQPCFDCNLYQLSSEVLKKPISNRNGYYEAATLSAALLLCIDSENYQQFFEYARTDLSLKSFWQLHFWLKNHFRSTQQAKRALLCVLQPDFEPNPDLIALMNGELPAASCIPLKLEIEKQNHLPLMQHVFLMLLQLAGRKDLTEFNFQVIQQAMLPALNSLAHQTAEQAFEMMLLKRISLIDPNLQFSPNCSWSEIMTLRLIALLAISNAHDLQALLAVLEKQWLSKDFSDRCKVFEQQSFKQSKLVFDVLRRMILLRDKQRRYQLIIDKGLNLMNDSTETAFALATSILNSARLVGA